MKFERKVTIFLWTFPSLLVIMIVMLILMLRYKFDSKPITPEQTFKSGYEYSKFYSNADEAWVNYCKNKYIGG